VEGSFQPISMRARSGGPSLTGMPAVDLLVNCYERTYRTVTVPGFFDAIDAQVEGCFNARYLLINNVADPSDARQRARQLKRTGEITDFAFVVDLLPEAMRVTSMNKRSLGAFRYLVDYGLAMTVFGDAPYFVGWDAEVRLDNSVDWVTPGVGLLEREPRVFSVNPDWPKRGQTESTMRIESFANIGPYFLNYGFCDQLFLVRRDAMAAPIFSRIAPVVWTMRHEAPRTFEARVESYQRSTHTVRATDSMVRYSHNDLPHPAERSHQLRGHRYAMHRALRATNRLLWDKVPAGPRFRGLPPGNSNRRGGWIW
jgi:hypothetical protein